MDILKQLLDACEDVAQQSEVRAAAIRARLLWRCDGQDCGRVNIAEDAICQANPDCLGRRPFPRSERIAEVLCDSSSEFPMEAEKLPTLGDVVKQGGYALEGACLMNVVVLRTEDGRYHVGEFAFSLEEVSEEEAQQTAQVFSREDEDEDEAEISAEER